MKQLGKSISWLTAILLATTAISCSSGGGGGDDPQPPSVDISGTWSGVYTSDEAGGFVTFTLNQDGNTITGTYITSDGGAGNFHGTLSGDSLEWYLDLPDWCPGEISGTGTCSATTMTLDFDGYDCEDSYDNGSASLNKV